MEEWDSEDTVEKFKVVETASRQQLSENLSCIWRF